MKTLCTSSNTTPNFSSGPPERHLGNSSRSALHQSVSFLFMTLWFGNFSSASSFLVYASLLSSILQPNSFQTLSCTPGRHANHSSRSGTPPHAMNVRFLPIMTLWCLPSLQFSCLQLPTLISFICSSNKTSKFNSSHPESRVNFSHVV